MKIDKAQHMARPNSIEFRFLKEPNRLEAKFQMKWLPKQAKPFGVLVAMLTAVAPQFINQARPELEKIATASSPEASPIVVYGPGSPASSSSASQLVSGIVVSPQWNDMEAIYQATSSLAIFAR